MEAKSKSEDPHLQRREKMRRERNPSRLRASMGNGSREKYRLSIILFINWIFIRTARPDSNPSRGS
jgi:hypothetical protein